MPRSLLFSNFRLKLSRICRDWNADPVFSIPGFGIGESLIPGSRRDYRDSGIRDSSVINPGIKKTGTGLQALDYSSLLYQRIVGLYGILTFSTAYSVVIVVMQSTVQLSPTNRATHWWKCNGVADLLKTRPSPMVLLCRIWSFCVKGCRHKYRRPPIITRDGRRRWPPPRLPTCVTTSNLVFLRQRVYA